MALCSPCCADVPLRNSHSLTHMLRVEPGGAVPDFRHWKCTTEKCVFACL